MDQRQEILEKKSAKMAAYGFTDYLVPCCFIGRIRTRQTIDGSVQKADARIKPGSDFLFPLRI